MLSKQKLRNAIYAMCALGTFMAVIGMPQVGIPFLIADIVLLGLYTATREDNITLKVKNLFESNLQVNEWIEKMKTDAKFAAAVEYVYSLSPGDLLTFGRLISELRYEADQTVLAQFADIFKKEDK